MLKYYRISECAAVSAHYLRTEHDWEKTIQDDILLSELFRLAAGMCCDLNLMMTLSGRPHAAAHGPCMSQQAACLLLGLSHHQWKVQLGRCMLFRRWAAAEQR